MKAAKTVKFTDLEVDIATLLEPYGSKGIIPRSWTRIQFDIPTQYLILEKINTWLDENTGDEWATYSFVSDRKSDTRTVVIKFKDRNDALMFKLRGGHHCWKDT